MASAARELEPDPLPADLSNKAPIISDIERGYAKDSAPYDEAESHTHHLADKEDGSRDRKGKKVKGQGLTEGDEGQLAWSL
jgi:hypothetical protein